MGQTQENPQNHEKSENQKSTKYTNTHTLSGYILEIVRSSEKEVVSGCHLSIVSNLGNVSVRCTGLLQGKEHHFHMHLRPEEGQCI